MGTLFGVCRQTRSGAGSLQGMVGADMSAASIGSNRRWRVVFVLGLASLLGACAGMDEAAPHCCYRGPYALTGLADVSLAREAAPPVRFADAFPDFQPATGLFKPALPFMEARMSDVVFARARAALLAHDANGDELTETPELIALYIQRAAIGLGLAVTHLEVGEPTAAIMLSSADVGGLGVCTA